MHKGKSFLIGLGALGEQVLHLTSDQPFPAGSSGKHAHKVKTELGMRTVLPGKKFKSEWNEGITGKNCGGFIVGLVAGGPAPPRTAHPGRCSGLISVSFAHDKHHF